MTDTNDSQLTRATPDSPSTDRISADKRAQLAARLRAAGPQQLLASEPIAIIGMGCRLPGDVKSPEQFWTFLTQGGDGIREVPSDRWNIHDFYDPRPSTPGKVATRWGGFLNDVKHFDAEFFGIAPKEATFMDPQQRIVLEVAWEALEHSGIVPASLQGTASGVFLGVCSSEYPTSRLRSPESIDAYVSTGAACSIVANRLSYSFDLIGPSLVVDTACSSSLVALHLACQSLRSDECQLALAGGVNLTLYPEATISFSQWGMMSPDGRCKTFDARADGYVRGEGCGIVVLKRLSKALKDGDSILALVRGSAINQDGRSNGLTAPNVLSQQAVIKQALLSARIDASRISYVECHGTGTPLGDPIEVEAIQEVYGKSRSDSQPLFLGALKTNIGHLEGAAGISGLIKAVLCLDHRQIPPNLNFRQLNPNISLEGTRFVLPTRLLPWDGGDEPRAAALSSFGFGGSNAHVVLEQAPRAQSPTPMPAATNHQHYLLPLSTRTHSSLDRQAKRLLEWLGQQKTASLRSVASTLAHRRTHHSCRLAIVAPSISSLQDQLHTWLDNANLAGASSMPDRPTSNPASANPTSLVFVYSGQGSQWPKMATDLLHFPVFMETLEHCSRIIASKSGWSLIPLLQSPDSDLRLQNTSMAQPAIVAVQLALLALLESWGITSKVHIGHSVGEISAAYACGFLSLEQAIEVACLRGNIMQQAAGQGRMLAIQCSTDALRLWIEMLRRPIDIAAINSPESIVVAGTIPDLTQLEALLNKELVRYKYLPGSYAFHSTQMKPLAERFKLACHDIRTAPGNKTMISTVSGQIVQPNDLNAHYWASQLHSPVLFQNAVEAAVRYAVSGQRFANDLIFVEVGPHPVLLPALSECLLPLKRSDPLLNTLRRNESGESCLLSLAGKLYGYGLDLKWKTLTTPAPHLPLPTYAWDRQIYWLEEALPITPPPSSPNALSMLPLLGTSLDCAALPDIRVFQNELSTKADRWLQDHQIRSTIVFPATAYVEMCLEAARTMLEPDSNAALVIEELELVEMMEIPGETTTLTQLVVKQREALTLDLECFSRPNHTPSVWRKNATGRCQRASPRLDAPSWNDVEPLSPPHPAADHPPGDHPSAVLPSEHYQRMAGAGLDYGPSFQGVQKAWSVEGEARAELAMPAGASFDRWLVHPGLLDSALQCIAYALPRSEKAAVFVPIRLHHLVVRAPLPSRLVCRIRVVNLPSPETIVCALGLFDPENGRCLLEISRLELKALRLPMPDPLAQWLYRLEWIPTAQLPTQQIPPPQSPITLPMTPPPTSEHLHSPTAPPATAAPARAGQKILYVGTDPLLFHRSKTGFATHNIDLADTALGLALSPSPTMLSIQADTVEQLTQRLLSWFPERTSPCSTIVVQAGLNGSEHSPSTVHQLEFAELCLQALVKLVQAILHTGWRDMPRLVLVTHGARPVLSDDPVQAEFAILWGFSYTLAQEFPEFRVLRLDLEPSDSAPWSQIADALARSDGEDRIAYRRSSTPAADADSTRITATIADPTAADARPPMQRFVERIVPLSSATPPAEPRTSSSVANSGLFDTTSQSSFLRPDGTYLVTGGQGGLGRIFADWLIARGARSIILLGRSSAQASLVEALQSWNERGITVKYGRCDIRDRLELETCINKLLPPARPLSGILHAAGVLEDAPIPKIAAASIQSVLSPKMVGTWNLHQLSLSSPLDFLVLFSSVASMLGAPGQALYSAANAYLDAFASYRHRLGLPATSISWGVWPGIGMADVNADRSLLPRIMEGLDIERGWLALDRILGLRTDPTEFDSTATIPPTTPNRQIQPAGSTRDLPSFSTTSFATPHSSHLGVFNLRLRQWLEFVPSAASNPFLSQWLESEKHQAQLTSADAWLLKRAQGAEPTARRTLLEQHLRAEISEALRLPLDRVEPRTPLGNIGIDSLSSLEIRNRIERSLGVSLSASLIWSYPTIHALTTHLAARLELDLAEESTLPSHSGPPSYADGSSQADVPSASLIDGAGGATGDETAADFTLDHLRDKSRDELTRLLEQELADLPEEFLT